MEDGQFFELRALDAVTASDRRPHTESGYFNNIDKAVEAVAKIQSASGIYVTLNPVKPALLARSVNKLRSAGRGSTTTDGDIERRVMMLVDCDPVRPAGIAASDAEHKAALARATDVDVFLSEMGFPAAVVADSGNGGHLLYAVDLPADDGGLIERCLKALAAKFDDEQVKIDTTVHNPARIVRLYGCINGKGDAEAAQIGRPQRMARILSTPETLEVVPQEKLEALAALAPVEERAGTAAANGKPQGGNFDVAKWIADHNLEVSAPKPWKGGGQCWTLPTCPWNPAHTNESAYIVQWPDGKLGAGCHHNGCQGKDWHALRDVVDPGWRERRAFEHEATAQSTATKPAPWQPFPVDVFPSPIREFVMETARAIGCDPSFVALPMLACLARAVGNARSIRLKRTWHELAIIWAAIVGKSGSHKTPAIKSVMRLLQRKQVEANEKYQEALRQYEQQRAQYEADLAAWKGRQKKHNQTADPDQREPAPWEPAAPVCKRYIVSDITIEALADRLAGQYDGVLLSRDELAGWINGIAEYKGGRGSDTGHWLAAWSGEPMTVDRKTGEQKMLHVPRAAVSLVGGIQPGILRRAIGREHMQDGLCARVLLAMPDATTVRWSEAEVPAEKSTAVENLLEQLLALEPAADANGNPEPYPLALGADAKRLWVEYYDRHRAEQAELDDDLAAAWSKLEAYTARFALIFALCRDPAATVINAQSMADAIALADWFGNEAKRVYGMLAEDDEAREQRELAEWIRRRGGEVTARDVSHGLRRFRNDAEGAEAALMGLVEAGYGEWKLVPPTARGGKPTRVFCSFTGVTVTETHANAEEFGSNGDGDTHCDPINEPDDDGAWGEL